MAECVSLLAREFWLEGELQSSCCCIFFGFNDGSWLKALYNDEVCSWEINDSDENPIQSRPLGDRKFWYPYKEYVPAHLQSLGELTGHLTQAPNKFVASFSSGVKLLLSYNDETESSHVQIIT